jgi:subtilisin family serine protease
MKFIVKLLTLLILLFSINVFSKEYPIVKLQNKNLKAYKNMCLIRLKAGYNDYSTIMKIEETAGIQFQEKFLDDKLSLTFNKNLKLTANLQSKDKIQKIYVAEEPLLRTYYVEYQGNDEPEQFCRKIKRLIPAIEIAEPFILPELLDYKQLEIPEQAKIPELLGGVPNDPYITSQTYLNVIKAYEAWDVEQGNSNIIIGISDSGMEQDHEDLRDNIAVNYGEIPGDNIDNDGNGYIDDYNGYNFAYKFDKVNPSNTSNNIEKHGQWVAGIAGASTNNAKGIAGVGYKCKIFPIKILEDGSLKYAYKSIIYAAVRGCKVLNMSWGSNKNFSDIDQSIIDYAISRDVALVCAAGNVGSGVDRYSTFYPASYSGVLAVGELDQTGELTPESVQGLGTRIMAPGEGDYTTGRTGYETCGGGTSFASPVVTGAVAIARSKYPQLSAVEAIEFVRQCSDVFMTQSNSMYKLTPGRLNMQKIVTIDPFSIPSIIPQNFVYYNMDGIQTERFAPGDIVDMQINSKNFLGAAGKIKFVLSEAHDPGNAVSIVDSVYEIQSVGKGESLTLKNFRIAILADYSEPVLLRVDLYGENGYRDFFKFEFIPVQNISTFENDKLRVSIADNGEFGFYTPSNVIGHGFVYKGFGNQIYENSTIMVTENSTNLVYNDENLSDARYDFMPVKKFVLPDQNIGVFNDNDALNNKIGVEIKQKVKFPSASAKSISIDIELKNISNQNLNALSIGYYIDWDVAGEVESNQVAYFPEAIPSGSENKTAPEIAWYNDKYPMFGAAFISNESNIQPQASGLDYNYTNDFTPEKRISTLNSGITIQNDTTYDISMVTGMKFNGITQPNQIRRCKACIAAGDNKEDLAKELKNCLLTLVGVNDNKIENYQIKISPQPAYDLLNIFLPNNLNEKCNVTITDILGNKLKSLDNIYLFNGNINVDVSDLNSGFYFLIIDSGIKIFSEKVIISR